MKSLHSQKFILIVFLLFLFHSSLFAQRDDGSVRITALSRYYVEIVNNSEYVYTVFQNGNRKFDLVPTSKRTVPGRAVESIRLKYTEDNYKMDISIAKRELNRLTDSKYTNKFFYLLAKKFNHIVAPIFAEVLELPVEFFTDRPAEVTDKEAQNIGDLIIEAYNIWKTIELKEKLDNVHARMLRAGMLYLSSEGYSTYSNIFQENYVYNIARNQKEFRHELTPVGGIDISIPVHKKTPNEFWERRGSGISYQIDASFPISPEIRWGRNSNVLSRFYGSIGFDRVVHNLDEGQSPYYVDQSYVRDVSTTSRTLYGVTSDDGKIIIMRQVPVAGYFRMMFHPILFFDIGGGYYAFRSSSLRFKPGDSDNPINHLGSQTLKEDKIDDITTSPHGLQSRGFFMFRVGVNADGMSLQKNRKYTSTSVTLTLKAYPINLEPTEQYQLYHDVDNLQSIEFGNVSLPTSTWDDFFYTINLGLTFPF